ncbi:MAG: SDR family oxidoreductase [Thalassovita sp.]
MTRVLVLGGYGLIGSACMRALVGAGMQIAGLGRSQKRALRSDPTAKWIIRDIPSLSIEDWLEILVNFDVVVNASGALQDGARDSLQAIHVQAVERLTNAARRCGVRIVQISAAGVSPDAPTEFFRSKARGDAIIIELAPDWVILRPTLVISPEAYGGTALLRAVASLPGVCPVVFPDAQVQTVHIDDVAAAVVRAANGEVPSGTIADLTEPEAQSFPDLILKMRRWLGVGKGVSVRVPNWVIDLSGKTADLLGYLGWRSPLRTTALHALQGGIRGDASSWPYTCRPLSVTLLNLPATRQERSFARLYLLLPLAIATLAIFWTISGLIGLFETDMAVKTLTDRGVIPFFAAISVGGGIVADIALGFAILWRRWTRLAALGMIVLSVVYLLGAAVLTPDLWRDPLGPMIKVFPGMTLALFIWLLIEDE